MTSTIDQIEQDTFDAAGDGQISYGELLTVRILCEIARQLERIASPGGVWEMSQADKDKKQALEELWAEKGIRDQLSEAELRDCDCVLPEHVCESCVKHAGETELVF